MQCLKFEVATDFDSPKIFEVVLAVCNVSPSLSKNDFDEVYRIFFSTHHHNTRLELQHRLVDRISSLADENAQAQLRLDSLVTSIHDQTKFDEEFALSQQILHMNEEDED